MKEPEVTVETRFQEKSGNAYALYRLADDPSVADLRYMPLDSIGGAPDKANYDAIYTARLPQEYDLKDASVRGQVLEAIFSRFNQDDRPEGFDGQSMSVSDIVALKQDGVVSYHYCDRVGFKELPDFGKQVSCQERHESVAKAQPSIMDKLRTMEQKPRQRSQKKAKETKKDVPNL